MSEPENTESVPVTWPLAWRTGFGTDRRHSVPRIPFKVTVGTPVTLIGLGALLLIMAVPGVLMVIDPATDWTTATIGWGLAAMVLAAGISHWCVWVRSPRLGWDAVELISLPPAQQPATFFPYPPSTRHAYLIAFTLVFLGAVAMLYGSLVADPTMSPYLARGWPVIALGGVVFLVGALPYLVSSLLRLRTFGVALTPDGVYHRSWMGGCFTSWDAISAIRPCVTSGKGEGPQVQLVGTEGTRPPMRTNMMESGLSELRWFRRRMRFISAGFLGVNPAVTYYALCFYHRHVELRHELGTGVGGERIRSGEMADAIEEVRRYGEVRPAYWQ